MILLAIAWATVGAWIAATIGVAQDGHLPTTILSVIFTAIITLTALAITVDYENKKRKNENNAVR